MPEENQRRLANLFIAAFVLVIIGYFTYGFFVAKNTTNSNVLQNREKPTPTITLIDYFSYKGKSGKSALELLKDKASIEQPASGLIISINGRKADASQHEYWAFYINGKLAQVGPADYQTKDEDLIEWKVEKY